MYMARKEVEEQLLEILNNIEVPDSRYEKAIISYKSVGDWLNREESRLKKYSPNIYPQGSFRLGTAIKPISENDEYDVDIVCELQLNKKNITQKHLKKTVGEELNTYTKSKNMNNDIEEGKRCWTLNYSDGAKFHIDVLPCIPNNEELSSLLQSKSFNVNFSDTAIDITDNTLENYNYIDDRWCCSNPVGYHNWFKKQMEVIYEEKKKILLEAYQKNSIEPIPEYKIKTPLQQVIQLLKRHRDIMFEEDQENKPISIIISTLAAKAYNNEARLIDAYENIVNKIEQFLEVKNGVYWVPNPVNPLENFADKWEVYPERKVSFFRWVNQLKLDFKNILTDKSNYIEKRDIYESMFGNVLNINELLTVSNIQEKYISHRHLPKWDMCIQENCSIIAYKSRDGFRNVKFRTGEPLLKKTKLRFEVKTNIRPPYKTYWRVTNSGMEAEKAYCLRGDFYEESIRKGKKVREETTTYKGVHTVECFIIKNGICTSKSEPFIVNVI